MSEDTTTNPPSQHEANKVVRVLNGKTMKYTIRIHHPDGNVLEFQSDEQVKLDWDTEDRRLWIVTTAYPKQFICRYVDGMVILGEENPK